MILLHKHNQHKFVICILNCMCSLHALPIQNHHIFHLTIPFLLCKCTRYNFSVRDCQTKQSYITAHVGMSTSFPYKYIYFEIQFNRKSCVINSELLWSEYKRMIPGTVLIICGHGGSVLHPNCYRK